LVELITLYVATMLNWAMVRVHFRNLLNIIIWKAEEL
jgi:hypothetical protein